MRLILKILAAPLVVALTLFVWICTILLYCTGMVLGLAALVVALLGVAVLVTYSLQNGIILLARLVNRVLHSTQAQLALFQGGSKDNAIPREVEAVLVCSPAEIEKAESIARSLAADFADELLPFEPDFTRAADGSDAFLLGIQVDHRARRDERLVQAGCAGQAGLLLGGKDALERRMGERVVIQDGHHERDGRTVVAAERGAVCGDYTVLHDQVNAVLLKIMRDAGQLFTDHIQMALQHDGGLVLGACAGRFFDDDVIEFVLMAPEAARLGKFHEIVADPLFVGRAARDCADLLKKVE